MTAIEKAMYLSASEALILTVSAAMSGTYQSAKNAAVKALIPESATGSNGPTMSLGWQVFAAARAYVAGSQMVVITEQVTRVYEKLVQIVAMETR
jgi:fatty acid-binding protein DegV